MWWVILWSAVTGIGAAGTLASLNSLRFARRVAAEARQLAAASAASAAPPTDLSTLPAPIQRYLTTALGGTSRSIRRARLRHVGSFRPSLDGSWLPIRGEQYFSASPPGFIWWGRVRIAPGIWIDARDRSVQGVGNMLVTLASTITIADSAGPELDQGALLRLLGEMAWFPTVYLDRRYISWTPIDDRRAQATLAVGDRRVWAEFAFDEKGLPVRFFGDRYRDLGGGKSALTPFAGRLADFRRVDGVLVPYRASAAWVIDGEPIEYADFKVQDLEFDWAGTP